MSLIRASATVGFFTLLSRIFGFVRDILIANFLGASWLADAFVVAFKLPNFLRRLFAEGAFNAAFVPLFAGKLAGDGKDKALGFASEAMSALFVVLLLVVAAAEIFMPWLLHLFAPGFVDQPEKFALATLLTRITFPYILFISLASLFSGVLNSIEKFAAVAATPILLNLSFIFALLVLRHFTETPAHALAWGVAAAGVVQFCWLLYNCHKHGMLPSLRRPRLTPNVKKLLTLIAPAALGAGVAQVNLLIDVILASLLPGAVSWLYYADRLNELPLGVIGIAVATALLPALSKQIREGAHDTAQHTHNRALEFALLLALPAATALILLAEPIITTLFERGAFSATDTAAAAPALMAYAAGLPAFVLIKIFAPGFFARQDTKTPFIIASGCMALNVVLNLILMQFYGHVGLAMATSIAGWVNGLLMGVVLHRRGDFVMDSPTRRHLPRIGLSCLIMAAALWGALWLCADYFAYGTLMKIGTLAVLIGLGLGVYGLGIGFMKVVELGDVRRYIKR